jgi:hypothetical protein
VVVAELPAGGGHIEAARDAHADGEAAGGQRIPEGTHGRAAGPRKLRVFDGVPGDQVDVCALQPVLPQHLRQLLCLCARLERLFWCVSYNCSASGVAASSVAYMKAHRSGMKKIMSCQNPQAYRQELQCLGICHQKQIERMYHRESANAKQTHASEKLLPASLKILSAHRRHLHNE